MGFADKIWKQVEIHEVVAEFLRSERARFPGHLRPEVTELTEKPDTQNAAHNHKRLRLLYIARRHIMGEIPPDTIWYEVHNLTDADLDQVHVISRVGWNWNAGKDQQHVQDLNELRSVALRRPQVLRDPPAGWRRPILWGHGRSGPFTIIEGNRRLMAYAGLRKTGLDIPVLIGISKTPCPWHIFDPVSPLTNDLWKHDPIA